MCNARPLVNIDTTGISVVLGLPWPQSSQEIRLRHHRLRHRHRLDT
jgi:hypothetical protein